MKKAVFFVICVVLIAISTAVALQVKPFVPVTTEMLLNPSPNDWLMFSRTYDAQRYSPLNQVTTQNVSQLTQAWTHEFNTGSIENIPTVYNGVMYFITPSGIVRALDATNGNMLWEYKRPGNGQSRSKNLAIFEDMIYYSAPDSYVVALDARTGALRWETKQDSRSHTSGPIVVEGKIISGGGGANSRNNCYISALDARTGKEIWRFYTTAGKDDPEGDASWAGTPEASRVATTWALPGSYDPVRRLIYWGIANPIPNTRMDRHGGNAFAIPLTAPADLYSNSTVALNPDTGKLVWYYQHLPGDDWDEDINEERTLIRTSVNPDPRFVKWINPDIPRGQMRDISVNVGEGGGIWALDRATGQFLWATPFPYDTPDFILSGIDVKTGKATINKDRIMTKPGDRHTVCFFNTRSYWPTAYSPVTNSLYVPFIDNCLDETAKGEAVNGQRGSAERRVGAPRPGADPALARNGLAKVNLSTGEIQRWMNGEVPSTGAVLATAGGLIFWGDLNQKFRAFDAQSLKMLWETNLGGPVTVSTITYAVNGRQYISVIGGDNLAVPGLITGTMGPAKVAITPNRMHNAIYTFALPAK
jgi:alcohol dehydrogenase (cytochrome c)